MQLFIQRGGERKQLTSTNYTHTAPSVSPDGKWVIFAADAKLRSDSLVARERGGFAGGAEHVEAVAAIVEQESRKLHRARQVGRTILIDRRGNGGDHARQGLAQVITPADALSRLHYTRPAPPY